MDCTTTSCIKYDFSELRGRIKAKGFTEGEFARAIKRSPQFVSAVFNGNSYFDMDDISNACDLLDIERNDIGFFFYSRVHKM